MTLTLELTPQEEATLNQQASVQNIDVNTLVRVRLFGATKASLPLVKHSGLAAILQAWTEEDATDDLVQIRKSEEEAAELLQNLQTNRVDFGEGHIAK